MKITKLWPAVLGFLLFVWGLLLIDAVSFDNSDTILGALALVAGLFVLVDTAMDMKEENRE